MGATTHIPSFHIGVQFRSDTTGKTTHCPPFIAAIEKERSNPRMVAKLAEIIRTKAGDS
jgi:hypothetical protein